MDSGSTDVVYGGGHRLTFYGTDVDTSVLGIGERNGICPLGALVCLNLTLQESNCGLTLRNARWLE